MSLPDSATRLANLAVSGGRKSPPNLAAFQGLGTGMPISARGGPPPEAGYNGSPMPVLTPGTLGREQQFALGGHQYQYNYHTVNNVDTIPVGTVWQFALGPDRIPKGWAIMDGKANARGSGIDMTDRFARGHASEAGTTGGNDTHTHGMNSHTHTVSAHTHSVSAHTHSVAAHTHSLGSHTHAVGSLAASSTTTGVTVSDHTDHAHKIGTYSETEVQSGTGVQTIHGSETTTGAYDTGGSSSATLSHSVNDSGHSHTVTGTTAASSGTTGSDGGGSTGSGGGGTTGSDGGGTTGAAGGATASGSTLPAYATLIWIEKVE